MSAHREELLRLVEELPETAVPAILDDVRRHLHAVKNMAWPRRGSALVKAVPLTWRTNPKSCSTTGSAAQRDHLRHPDPLVAAALSNDADHPACVRLFTDMHTARRELLVPATVVAEVRYLPSS